MHREPLILKRQDELSQSPGGITPLFRSGGILPTRFRCGILPLLRNSEQGNGHNQVGSRPAGESEKSSGEALMVFDRGKDEVVADANPRG
jgi:hypothetical protein